MEKLIIYTIGHSTHPIDYFISLLKIHKVNCVLDVRSIPASRYNPQYNQKAFVISLQEQGIAYLHLPEEFGARQTDPAVLDENGQVDFEKVQLSERFKTGLSRLRNGCRQGYVIALMCAENDPLHCHRFFMISVALNDFEVKHILKDGTAISQPEQENELLRQYEMKLRKLELFDVHDPLKYLFRLKNREMGYVIKQ